MVRLALAILFFCTTLAPEAKNAAPDAPLALAVSGGGEPRTFHIVLRNTSNAPVHVLLGVGNGNGEISLGAFSFHVVDATGRKMEFVAFGIVIVGVVNFIQQEIAPGQAWSGDIPLETLVLTEHLENPRTADTLAPGAYTVQAVFQGRRRDWPPDPAPFWIGTVQSPTTPYVIAK